jgi:hypothetical protein
LAFYLASCGNGHALIIKLFLELCNVPASLYKISAINKGDVAEKKD